MNKKHTKKVIRNGKIYTYYVKKVTMPDGKRKEITANNKKEWDKKYAQFLKEFNSGVQSDSRNLTIADVSKKYLADFHSTDAPKTYQARDHHLSKYINPAIGHVKARSLSTNQIRHFYREISATKNHKKVEQNEVVAQKRYEHELKR